MWESSAAVRQRIGDVHPESDREQRAERLRDRTGRREGRGGDGGRRHSPPSFRRPGLADVSGGESAAPPPSDAGFTRFSERQTGKKATTKQQVKVKLQPSDSQSTWDRP